MGKDRFSNPYIRNIRRSFWDFVKWQWGGYEDRLPVLPPPQGFSYPLPREACEERKPKETWINHCTFLIDIDGIKFLTDPIWSRRCSPVPFVGPKRKHQPAMEIKNLPQIDAVLI